MAVKSFQTWKDNVRFSAEGPQHTELIGTDVYKAVLVGLEAGQRIPPHPSSAAAYHFLEGSGWMEVNGERMPVEPGTTVVVPAGVSRGVQAETRLAFFGSHGAKLEKKPMGKPTVMFGGMVLFSLLIMVGLMLIGASPMAMMFSNLGSLGMGFWGPMILPFVGLLGMFVMMFFMFRWMRSGSGMMAGHSDHREVMALMKGGKQGSNAETHQDPLSTQVYSIPSISCDHCKDTIERALGEIPGVESVSVDVQTKQVIVGYNPPIKKTALESVLTNIGYPPASE